MKIKQKILTTATLLTAIGLTFPVKAENPASFTTLPKPQQCQGCNQSKNQANEVNKQAVVAMPISSAFTCVQSVLTSRQESIFKVDQKQGVVMTSLRSVEPEELERIANTSQAGERIRWTQGSYQLTINLTSVSRQKTQLQVSARIMGSGETSLPLMRPSMLQSLPSTGRLESDILTALTSQCRGRANR